MQKKIKRKSDSDSETNTMVCGRVFVTVPKNNCYDHTSYILNQLPFKNENSYSEVF